MPPSPEFLKQHAALTNAAGVAVPGRTLLAVCGAERTSFLHSFLTNDIKRLAPGSGCEAFVTSPQGKTLGHAYVFCEAQRHVLDTVVGQADALTSHFNRYVISEDVEFHDLSGSLADLLVAGAQAAEVLTRVAGTSPPTERLSHAAFTIAGQPAVVRRVDYAGPNSYFVQVERSAADIVQKALIDSGATACGEPALEAARIEAGFPRFGLDITPENLPQEVGRDALAISFTKGCYLGQETVARIDAVGHVNRQLVALRFAGTEMPAAGTTLLHESQPVGAVTSAAWSPRVGAPLALGYVRRAQAKPGTVLATAGENAVVVPLSSV